MGLMGPVFGMKRNVWGRASRNGGGGEGGEAPT